MKKETFFGKWYQKWIGRWMPAYGVFPLIACCLLNNVIYWGAQVLMADSYHYDFTNQWDRKIPFTPEWIIIYVASFAFWAINYILISREGRDKWFHFVTADMFSRVICGVFFLVLPTTNIRPEVTGTGFCNWLMQLVYHMDAPTNLFPSIHCLVSWFCFIGVRKSKKLPLWYKIFDFVFAVLICASTQFTKQHYLVDIAGGIILAEVCWYITNHTGMYKAIKKLFDRFGHAVFGVAAYDE